MNFGKAFVVVGLGYGDEGKGSIVDFLSRRYEINKVVRFSGGSQCCHNVVDSSGKHHGFSQFGSGSFVGAHTYLSKFTLVDPILLLDELDRLGAGHDKLIHVDPDSTVITPIHVIFNKIKSLNSKQRNTCGLGIGEARRDELNGLGIQIKDLKDNNLFSSLVSRAEIKLKEIKKTYLKYISHFNFTYTKISKIVDIYNEFVSKIDISSPPITGNLIFEGSQGVLIDETYGTEGYNTWTDTTFNNALKLLKENNYQGKIIKLGVMRSYMTRHGSGPFPTESSNVKFEEKHNYYNEWQGGFRQGYLDLPLIKYSIECCGGIDGLVVNHLDRLSEEFLVCVDREGDKFKGGSILKRIKRGDFLSLLEDCLEVRVVLTSAGPTWKDKTELVAF